MNVLERIYARKACATEDERALLPEDRARDLARASIPDRRGFLHALRSAPKPAIVAEIKRASPSSGVIAQDVDVRTIARTYETAGAAAISVLTERDHFLGDLSYLARVRSATRLPILRKDFLWSSYHVAQSAACGADALLLIVAALSDDALHTCLREAQRYALDVLVEVHDEDELRRAVQAGAQLIGVNNRNLSTMSVDLAIGERLLPKVPAAIYALAESGMRQPSDAARMTASGADGLLVGEALMRSASPEAFIGAIRGR